MHTISSLIGMLSPVASNSASHLAPLARTRPAAASLAAVIQPISNGAATSGLSHEEGYGAAGRLPDQGGDRRQAQGSRPKDAAGAKRRRHAPATSTKISSLSGLMSGAQFYVRRSSRATLTRFISQRRPVVIPRRPRPGGTDRPLVPTEPRPAFLRGDRARTGRVPQRRRAARAALAVLRCAPALQAAPLGAGPIRPWLIRRRKAAMGAATPRRGVP